MSKAEFINLSDFVNQNDLNECFLNIEKITSIHACRSFVFENYKVGELNYTSVLRFFQTGEMKDTKEYIDNYKLFLKAGVLFINGWKNILQKNSLNPDFILIFNGVLSTDSLVVEYCKMEQVKYATHECFYGNNSWIYKVNGDVMTLFWEKQWADFMKKEFRQDQRDLALNYMNGFKKGEKHYIRFNHDFPLKSDLEKDKFVVLFTNLNFDTAVLGRNPVFRSMHHWIESVIDFWIKNDVQTKLVIRVHPAESKVLSVAEDRVGKRIMPLIQSQQNIIFFDSDEEVDSYKLIQNMKFSLVYASTIGLEIAIMKKICLVAGNAHYRRQNFAIFHDDMENYFMELRSLLMQEELINHCSEDAIKYSYFLFNERVKQISGLKTDHLNKVNDFQFKDLADLIAQNEDLLSDFISEVHSY
jgi:hypothetical protein